MNVVMVPANYSDRLQPLDISVNMGNWYATQICDQLETDGHSKFFVLKLSMHDY